MQSLTVVALSAGLAAAQFVPPPAPVELTAAKSGVIPVLPAGFTGVATLEGAIINQAPPNASYTPVNGPAQVQSNLPAATYTATFPSVAFDALTGTTISGTVSGSSQQGASGVTFNINLSNLPSLAEYGPFMYHLHDMPVPADGNCTSTMGHFDPTNSGEYYMCDTSAPQNCQAGDLAGKHGKIMTSPTFSTSFVDPYLSTDPSSQYFFGARSIVIHTANTTRLTCANFVQGGSSSSAPSGVAGATGGASAATATVGSNGTAPTLTASPSLFTGAANKEFVAGGAIAGVAALAALLL